MPPQSPYEATHRLEQELRRGLFGEGNTGALGALRSPSAAGQAALIRGVRTNSPKPITLSRWWGQIWRNAESELRDVLERIARRSGGFAWDEAAGRFRRRGKFAPALEAAALLGRPEARELAVDHARRRAAEIVEFLRQSQAVVAQRAVFELRDRELVAREIAQEIALRLGPSERQLRRILVWQAREEAAGRPRRQILQSLARRTRAASLQRATVIASDELVRQVSESRLSTFGALGLLVYSENMRDERVRSLHREQTRITRANPTRPDESWREGPPFSGRPPYEVRCRCWIESSR